MTYRIAGKLRKLSRCTRSYENNLMYSNDIWLRPIKNIYKS